ncbi:MAG: M14 metallopeptidase family protein, partial [Planctomycetota bacterium]
MQRLVDAQQPGPQPAGADWYDDYKTYDEVNTRLLGLESSFRDLATVFEVGVSIEGRSIYGIRISSDASEKPAFVIQGCQHAREWVTVMTVTYIAETLLEQSMDPAIQLLLDRINFYIVPIVNPDGYAFSWDVERLWRKNRRNNGDGTFGVDLNRNWSYAWGGEGSSGSPQSNTYRGTAPFSEPETAAVSAYITSLPDVRLHLDIHSYSQLVLQPWGFTLDLPPDHDTLDAFGEELVAEISGVHGARYEHGPGAEILYVASGIAGDWSYGELGVPGLTYELRDQGQFGFLLPPEQIIPTCEEIWAAMVYSGEWMVDPPFFK